MRQAQPWRRGRSGAWYAWVKGRQVKLAPADATKQAAWEALRSILGGSRPPTHPTARPSFRDAANTFLGRQAARVESGQIVAATYEHFATLLSRASRTLGDRPADEITPDAVLGWASSQTWGAARRRAAVQAVRSAVRHAARSGLIGRDPLAGMKPPPAVRRSFDATADIRAQLAADSTDEAWSLFLFACISTGARPGEIAGATAADFDASEGTLRVKNKTAWSTGRPDRILILPPAMTELCSRLARERPTGPLFLNSQNRPWRRWAWGARMRRSRHRLGLSDKLVLYSMRSAFITDCLESGVGPATVAELAGHQGLSMIMAHYSNLKSRRDHLREAVRKVRPGTGGTAPASTTPRPAPRHPSREKGR